MLRLCAVTLLGAAVLACAGEPPSTQTDTPTATPSPTASLDSSAPPTALTETLIPGSSATPARSLGSPIASFGPTTPASVPTGGEPLPPEIVRWHVIDDAIHIELFNPNYGFGLLRAEFRISVRGVDGQVFAVLGLSGSPGTPASTILQLPPRGSYGLVDFLPAIAPPVGALELSLVAGQWMDWPKVNPPQVSVTDFELDAAGLRPRITGELEIRRGAGTFNVWVMAFVEKDDGFVIADGALACVEPGSMAAFEVRALSDFTAGSVTRIAAYVTTVPDVPGSADGLDSPPGC